MTIVGSFSKEVDVVELSSCDHLVQAGESFRKVLVDLLKVIDGVQILKSLIGKCNRCLLQIARRSLSQIIEFRVSSLIASIETYCWLAQRSDLRSGLPDLDIASNGNHKKAR